jgi:hypothetical protein
MNRPLCRPSVRCRPGRDAPCSGSRGTGWIQSVVATPRHGGVAMGIRKRRRSARARRGPMRSPGRPTAGRREHRQRFWEAIRVGLSSEDAALAAGVSQPVGTRWFRESGGMPPFSLAPLSGRYLSFAEREEIAILHSQHRGPREIARRINRSPSTVSRELRRNAATRAGGLEYRATTAQWHADRKAKRPKVAKLAAYEKLRRYVQDRLAGMIVAPDGTGLPGVGDQAAVSSGRS